MKSLDQKGADARRVDSTRTLIRAISTKMGVAVQVIDKIAITINKLMDEELWPQINELIHRYIVSLVKNYSVLGCATLKNITRRLRYPSVQLVSLLVLHSLVIDYKLGKRMVADLLLQTQSTYLSICLKKEKGGIEEF